MKTILQVSGGVQVEYDPVLGGFGRRSTPCFQCGTCCSRWQAPVNSNEVQAIAANLGIPIDKFYSEYIRTYPVRPDSYLLAHKDGGCVFLKREGRRALCSIYDFRPAVCRDWTPSLSRKECREGLTRLGEPTQILRLSELNIPGSDIAGMCQSLQDFGQSSIMGK